jgi:hypothetical protein
VEELLRETLQSAVLILVKDVGPKTRRQVETLGTVLDEFDSHHITAGQIPLHGILCFRLLVIEHHSFLTCECNPKGKLTAVFWSMVTITIFAHNCGDRLTDCLNAVQRTSRTSPEGEQSTIVSETSGPSNLNKNQQANEHGSSLRDQADNQSFHREDERELEFVQDEIRELQELPLVMAIKCFLRRLCLPHTSVVNITWYAEKGMAQQADYTILRVGAPKGKIESRLDETLETYFGRLDSWLEVSELEKEYVRDWIAEHNPKSVVRRGPGEASEAESATDGSEGQASPSAIPALSCLQSVAKPQLHCEAALWALSAMHKDELTHDAAKSTPERLIPQLSRLKIFVSRRRCAGN